MDKIMYCILVGAFCISMGIKETRVEKKNMTPLEKKLNPSNKRPKKEYGKMMKVRLMKIAYKNRRNDKKDIEASERREIR